MWQANSSTVSIYCHESTEYRYCNRQADFLVVAAVGSLGLGTHSGVFKTWTHISCLSALKEVPLLGVRSILLHELCVTGGLATGSFLCKITMELRRGSIE
jgi:hypothetical protein